MLTLLRTKPMWLCALRLERHDGQQELFLIDTPGWNSLEAENEAMETAWGRDVDNTLQRVVILRPARLKAEVV